MKCNTIVLAGIATIMSLLIASCGSGSGGSTGNDNARTAKLVTSDGATSDCFGESLSVSADGNTIVVGASYSHIGGKADQGAVYVYKWNGSAWNETKLTASDGAAGDRFGVGVSVASDGSTILAGAFSADISTNADQGAVYVFKWDGSGWVEKKKLIASDGAADDRLGYAVAQSSDGNVIVAGAYNADIGGKIDQGAAYVYKWNGSDWAQVKKLTGSDSAAGDSFGTSVSVSADAGVIAIGASNADLGGKADQGAVYVCTAGGSDWTETKKLTSSDGAADRLGYSLAISGDGNTIAAGAPGCVIGSNIYQGAAYIFTWDGSNWGQSTKLTAADGKEGDQFGFSVSVSSTGGVVLVGAPNADVDAKIDQGAAYAYTLKASSWIESKIVSSGGSADDSFGFFVALSSGAGLMAAGAYGQNSAQGAVYVFD